MLIRIAASTMLSLSIASASYSADRIPLETLEKNLCNTRDSVCRLVEPVSVKSNWKSKCFLSYQYAAKEKPTNKHRYSEWNCGSTDGYGVNMLKLASLALISNSYLIITLEKEHNDEISSSASQLIAIELLQN